ncbi:MAG TPA: ATP-binding protein, partial [Jatrophihabitans sp.]|nr:ATP-binding protein [Jatrophihabitans sp.]
MRTRAAVLVGRAAELAAATSGTACFLVGEPGVGKSRLLSEVSRQAESAGLVVARGRASALGPASPLRPFAEALAGIHRCGLLPDDDLGGYRPLLARVLPGADRTGLSRGAAAGGLAEAVLRTLSVLGGRARGCLLILEDRDEAERHAALAGQAAEIYPAARHLAARLIAPVAAADGWGAPVEDLRAAEIWFHEQDVTLAARSCRDVLRTLGVSVQQRRDDLAAVPPELRAAGVTAREYEVGLPVREHLG